jgi:hypothetical protein
MSLFGETCENSPLTMWPTPTATDAIKTPGNNRHASLKLAMKQSLTSSPPAIPASHSQSPGSDWARRMTATYGRKFADWYLSSGPPDSWVRTLLGMSIWVSMTCYLTWKRSATPAGRLLFRLVPWAPRTAGTGSGFWPFPMPSDVMGGRTTKGKDRQDEGGLRKHVMWPTPSATFEHVSDMENQMLSGQQRQKLREAGTPFESRTGQRLNSAWVSRMMGYPDSWMDVGEETP